MARTVGEEAIEGNCVDCHMLMHRDLGTPLETAGDSESPRMRDHVIGIYPETAQRILKQLSARTKPER